MVEKERGLRASLADASPHVSQRACWLALVAGLAARSLPAVHKLSHSKAEPTADRHHAADGDAADAAMTTLFDAARTLRSAPDRRLLDGRPHGHRVSAPVNNRAVSNAPEGTGRIVPAAGGVLQPDSAAAG